MTTYMRLNDCQILCGCKRTNSLCRLYFCRHCLDVRCSDCVSHEVDSHYCPNCLENMASAEAKMRKHRCGNCFDCPSCGHTLSTRATAVMHAKPDEPGRTMAQKAYYLTCGFCRWSTRDSGIPDQRQSAGGWQEATNPFAKRISELIDSYHHLAVKEKADREWSKFVRKRNYMILLERYPVLNPRLRRYCSSSWTTPNRETEPSKPVTIPAAEAPTKPVIFDIEPHISQPLQLEKITTVRQRHLIPQIQPTLTARLEPHPKYLAVKRSMRCRTCEHNLSKSDFNPTSIKFRINLSALYHVPELRYILTGLSSGASSASGPPELQRRTSRTVSGLKSEHLVLEDIAAGKTVPFVLTICNPAHRVTTVSLRQLTAQEEAESLAHLIGTASSYDDPFRLENSTPNTAGSHVDSAGDTTSSESTTPCFSTVKLTLPTGEIKLAPRNDIADYDDSLTTGALSSGEDDSKIIAFRRGNKVGIHASLTPIVAKTNRTHSSFALLPPLVEAASEDPTKLSPTELGTEHTKLPSTENVVPLRAALSLHFDYKNATTSLLSEHRAAAAAAVAAAASASASATNAAKVSKEASESTTPSLPTATVQQGDQINHIQVTVILHFGDMLVV